MPRGRKPSTSRELPPPLPPERRTVGQAVAEAVRLYGARFAKNFPRQMLHAWKLGFHHPRTGEWKNFEAQLPHDFKQAIAAISAKG